MLGDRKIARICKATGRPKALVLGVWTVILCLAGQSEQTGKLLISAHIPYTVEDIADETNLDTATVQAIVDEMIALQMLTREPEGMLVVTHWAERQFESDISTTRVNRHRQRREATSQEMDETATMAQVSSGETFQETDETQRVAEAPLHETLQNQNQIQNQNRNRIRIRTDNNIQTDTETESRKMRSNAVVDDQDDVVDNCFLAVDNSIELVDNRSENEDDAVDKPPCVEDGSLGIAEALLSQSIPPAGHRHCAALGQCGDPQCARLGEAQARAAGSRSVRGGGAGSKRVRNLLDLPDSREKCIIVNGTERGIRLAA